MKLNKSIFCPAILILSFSQEVYSLELLPKNSWLDKVMEVVSENKLNDKTVTTNSGPKKPDPSSEQSEG